MTLNSTLSSACHSESAADEESALAFLNRGRQSIPLSAGARCEHNHGFAAWPASAARAAW